MRRRRWIILLAGFLLGIGGCAAQKTVTNLPAGVSQQQVNDWNSAVTDLQKVATVTTGIRQAVIAARGAGAFPDNDAYAATLQTLAKVDDLQLSAVNVLQAAPQTFSSSTKTQVASLVTQILSQLQTLNVQGVTSIKDSSTLTNINNLLGEAIAATKLVIALTS